MFWSAVPPLMLNSPSNQLSRVFTDSPSLELKWTVGTSVFLLASGAAKLTVFVVMPFATARYWCETSRGSEIWKYV